MSRARAFPPGIANQHAAALHRLGLLAHQDGDDASAADLIRQAIAATPRGPNLHANLGVVLLRARRPQEAAAALRTAIRLEPADFGAHANLGVALFALGEYEAAAKAAGSALRLRPQDAATLGNRALALQAAGNLTGALADCDAAIAADPAQYGVHLTRGALLLAMGRAAQALAVYEAAIALQPDDVRARQARITATNYLPDGTTEVLGRVARRLAPLAAPGRAAFAARDRSAPLRIGYVSADFCNHPVAYFLEGVLAARDRAESVVFCYDNGLEPDATTARLRATVDHWRPIAALDDATAAQMIRDDRIDILVDLAGHTQGNRLGVFARRAAPVQAAWLGYFGTTGGAAIDFVIADETVLPAHDEPQFTERVVRLPDSYLCFSRPAEAGPVASSPSGPVTFGCFNNRAKLGPAVLELWSRLLAEVPGSRLLLKSAQYADDEIRRAVSRAFNGHGIGRERLAFEGASPLAAMFAAYAKVDIALDPFPFAGGATTAQALWMGVPVITLRGRIWAGRQGASLLRAAGLEQWIAEDAHEYVAIAKSLAADRAALGAIRASLRDRVAGSALCRADRFAANLHTAYRAMWQEAAASTA